ncbi:MAG: sulfotransferase [Kiloniellaceae bacterium]
MHSPPLAPSALFSAFNAAGNVLTRCGFSPPPLDESALLDEARQRASLDDFGGEAFREPLRVLLGAYEAEASLNLLGRLATRWETMQLLVNRLRLVEDRKRHPGIADQAIRRPMFIVGLPRSGTTLLHGLLAQDPANRAPLTWEAMYPPPPTNHGHPESNPQIAKADRQIRWFHRLAPEFRKIHPVAARLPQECIAITAHTFASPRFHTTYRIPSYQRWLDHYDQRPCYAFHRRFLQHLQYRSATERWVLKSPAHLFTLDRLFAEYPDALVVQTHRDPVTVLASVASLTAALQRVFSDFVDLPEIGAEVANRWERGVERAIRARETLGSMRDQFFDVRYPNLVRDPVATVRRIYAHFDLPLGAEALARMKRFVAENPKSKHGDHSYSLSAFGLNREEEAARFRPYRERFGLESDRGPKASSP